MDGIEGGVGHDNSRAEDQILVVSEWQGTGRIKLILLELQCFERHWETLPLRCARWVEKNVAQSVCKTREA